MIAVILALACATGYGASDFLGGAASRRCSPTQVALVAQLAAAVAVLAVAPFAGGHLGAGAIGWGALSGSAVAVGTVALYRGMGRGAMSVVGPVSGVGAAAIPVVVGLAFGDRPSFVSLLGVVAVLPAVWLIARDGNSAVAGGLVEGMIAGVGFGAFFLALDQAPGASGLWPSAASEVASSLLIGAYALTARQGWSWAGAHNRRTFLGAVLAGACAAVAVSLYLLATRRGLLAVVAVVASLYPGVTVLLARFALRERLRRTQLLGLVVAAGAVVAITAG